jgi:hypothetical protein
LEKIYSWKFNFFALLEPRFELPEGGDEELGCLTVGADGPGHGHPVVLVQGGVHLVKQVEGRRVTLLYISSKTEYLEYLPKTKCSVADPDSLNPGSGVFMTKNLRKKYR